MAYLKCSVPGCGITLDLHDRALACTFCGGLLEVENDPVRESAGVLKERWLDRRKSYHPLDVSGVWRFREFLPYCYGESGVVSLGEGNVPLIRGQKTAKWADVQRLWFKHLGWNPTGSFKDLGMTAGMTEAKYLGAKAVACASTGNTAASLAAYAARAGMTGRVYLPTGQASNNKLAQALDFGAEIVQVDGNFDDALNTLLAGDDPELYFLNSINPFRIEGQKTAVFELLEQLEWQAPEYLIIPGGNLGNSSAFGKGLRELKSANLIDRLPKMIIVQAEGANPLARMWSAGVRELTPLARPETVATAIRIGNPRSWKKAIDAVEATGGLVMDVTDAEIGEAKAMIGRDGIGCEPASATTLAGLRKLRSGGKIERDATVAAILTGHVLKDTDYIIKHQAQQISQEPFALTVR